MTGKDYFLEEATPSKLGEGCVLCCVETNTESRGMKNVAAPPSRNNSSHVCPVLQPDKKAGPGLCSSLSPAAHAFRTLQPRIGLIVECPVFRPEPLAYSTPLARETYTPRQGKVPPPGIRRTKSVVQGKAYFRWERLASFSAHYLALVIECQSFTMSKKLNLSLFSATVVCAVDSVPHHAFS